MGKVYVVNHDGSTTAMKGIRCENEELELQRLLEKNPDLIPGEQVNQSDPSRWLIIKREMPVPDPSSGIGRWSIDFFFSDQDAMPTFIECKRCNDTRARREIVGQILEYAANGHYYWSKDDIRQYAEDFAKAHGLSIEEEMNRLKPEDPEQVDDFFQRIQDNLRVGKIRLIFFLDEAPNELKSIVDYLNKQMERSEVLLVEARQFEYDKMRVVAPTLFGYTEEVRQAQQAKKTLPGVRVKRDWDKETFFADAKDRLAENEVESLKKVYDKVLSLSCETSWGTGKTVGSLIIKWPLLGKYSPFALFSDGTLSINFGNFSKTEKEQAYRDFLKDKIISEMNLSIPSEYERRYPNYNKSEWMNKTDGLLSIMDMTEKYQNDLNK